MSNPATQRKIIDAASRYSDIDERYYEWEDGLSSAGLSLILPKSSLSTFDWCVTGYHFDQLIGGILTASEHDIQRRQGNLFAVPDHVLLFIVLVGGLDCQCRGRRFEVGQGDMLIQDMSQPVSISVRAGSAGPCTYQYFILPKSSMAFSVDIAPLHGHCLQATSPLNRMLRGYLATMLALFDQMTEMEVKGVGKGASNLIIETLALLSGKALDSPFEHSTKLERVCLIIESSLATQLTVEILCKRFALSRASLYRLFEPLGGVACFIRNRRLAMAQRMMRDLSMRHLSLSAISRRCGLEPSVLRHHCIQHYGEPPREIRRELRTQFAHRTHAQHEPTHVGWVSTL